MTMVTPQEYSRTCQIASYEVGLGNTLRLSVLLRMAQETSELHLAELGLGFEKLWEDGLVFLITTNLVKIKRMPRHREKVTIQTHPRGTAGAQFYRDFLFYVEGEQVAAIMQASISADPHTHKLLRPKVFLSNGVFRDEPVDPSNRLEKLRFPDQMNPVGERVIRYSDLDQNGHLNNAIYADILCDFLPNGLYGKSFREVQINYVNECTLGETLKLSVHEQNDAIMMRGEHERGLSFSAKAVLTSA